MVLTPDGTQSPPGLPTDSLRRRLEDRDRSLQRARTRTGGWEPLHLTSHANTRLHPVEQSVTVLHDDSGNILRSALIQDSYSGWYASLLDETSQDGLTATDEAAECMSLSGPSVGRAPIGDLASLASGFEALTIGTNSPIKDETSDGGLRTTTNAFYQVTKQLRADGATRQSRTSTTVTSRKPRGVSYSKLAPTSAPSMACASSRGPTWGSPLGLVEHLGPRLEDRLCRPLPPLNVPAVQVANAQHRSVKPVHNGGAVPDNGGSADAHTRHCHPRS